MTVKEFLKTQLDDALFQLEKVLDGVEGSHVDGKPIATMLSLRETVGHLAETYHAVEVVAAGGKHEWGSYHVEETDWDALVARVFAMRATAVETIMGMDEDKAAEMGHAYLIAHDYYHVGQLVALRVAAHPDWNAYSIYTWG
jgi:uncharacterized damage-inducible protein DinB